MRKILFSAMLTVLSLSFSAGAEPQSKNILRLEDLDLSHMTQGWGTPGIKKTILDLPLTINGQVFEHGVGTHSVSRLTIDLKGAALAFRAWVGLDDEDAIGREKQGSVDFRVYVDRKKVFDSGVMKLGDGPKAVEVDLRGAKRLDLEVMDGGDTTNYDHANWADAYLELHPNATARPETLPRKKLPVEILTPEPSPAPRINAPSVIGAGENREFFYHIPVAGKRPMNLKVEGLPANLTFDPDNGTIFGLTEGPGEIPLVIRAENKRGRDEKQVRLVVGSKLALTPPMGWNSWNCWGKEVRGENIRDAARAMADSGLIHHGWSYICIDDGWEGQRDRETLRLDPNEKFPDMKDLGDFIHSLGLKFGIYTDVGYMTCQGLMGSRGYDFLDADTFARWGVDYVKADWCYAHGMNAEASYKTLGLAIRQTGRDMVYSVCTAGYSVPWKWAESVGGNLWRTGEDIRDNWHSVYTRVSKEHYSLHDYAKPGHWNDPDMLVVGKVGWGQPLRDSELTPNQQYSHISLWSILAAPLILGCDLTQLNDFTLALLTNDEVLAVNQDVLGKQGRRVIQENRFEVWVKELADGAKAVGIFNIAPSDLDETASRNYTLAWESIGLSGPQAVRDLWRQKDLGVYREAFPVHLPEYGVSLVKVTAK